MMRAVGARSRGLGWLRDLLPGIPSAGPPRADDSPGSAVRVRLWVKLALLGSLGVVVTHAVHLTISNRLADQALMQSQEALGRNVARLVASEAADSVLLDDLLSLRALTKGTVSRQGISYCFIVREGRVVASSFPGPTPAALVSARSPSDVGPIVVVSGPSRYLDLVEPILGGSAGVARVGIDLTLVESTKHEVSVLSGTVALFVIAAGLIAAFAVGRSIALPVARLVAVSDKFDPSGDTPIVQPKTRDEIGELTVRFNQMMVRLKAAHDEQVRAREKESHTERMVALGTLIAGVAHEINNPLAGMKTCLRRLQRNELVPPAKRDEYLEIMEEGLERIEDVMQHLLDFARPRPLRLDEIDLRDVIREGSSLLRPMLARRHIALREDDLSARVIADRKQASQALLNLLLNATYVTKEGGEVRLRVCRRPGYWGIAVEDDGPGIPLELRERILDPFFSTKPEGEGTGLGLSVTKSIIEAHGGELTLAFPPCGTTATLWFREAEEALDSAIG